MQQPETEALPSRSLHRRFAAMLIISTATALALGTLLRQPTMMGANDISRWCTVWSLLERGTYVIDECPWLTETQDKIYFAPPARAAEPAADPEKHYYSSKPAFLPTLIAAFLAPLRLATGVPLDQVVFQEREPRWVQKVDPSDPGKPYGVLETPDQPVKWPAQVFYFEAALVVLNIVPFLAFLILYARVLDRYAANDWAWLFSLTAAAFGTFLLPFLQTLNNHTVAAFFVFFAVYQFLRIWDEWELAGWRFAAVGFCAAFAAANDLPAAAFLALSAGLLLLRYPGKTIRFLMPGALVPIAGFAAAQYAAFGEFRLAYEEFGREAYQYEGSLWKTPLELDALNLPWLDPEEAARRGIRGESHGLYLFHMTLGHHGFWSLTPIFLLSLGGLPRLLKGGGWLLTAWTILTVLAIGSLLGVYVYDPGAWTREGRWHENVWVFWLIPALLGLLAILSWARILRRGGEPMAAVGWMTVILTVVVLAFYTWNPKARNYGGSTQGLRWLFWLIPLWLLLLPKGVEGGQERTWIRRLAIVALAVSVLSVGYAMRNPWSHPWILDALEHLGVYPLPR
jgi:hypothetical protein